MCVCVCVCVCGVCMYVCMYVRVYVCMYVCMYGMYVCMYVCICLFSGLVKSHFEVLPSIWKMSTGQKENKISISYPPPPQVSLSTPRCTVSVYLPTHKV